MSTQVMPAPKNCAECNRLWEQYTQASTAHLRVVVQHHKAAFQNDPVGLDEIAAMETALAQQVMKARRAIDDHEAEHEPAPADGVQVD
jgi:hypothetical protein